VEGPGRVLEARNATLLDCLGTTFHLDTRAKILTAAEAREKLKNPPVRWISGHFDPLLAEHTRRLISSAAPGKLLVVEIIEPLQPLLSQRARAELVAALAVVDYAVLSDRNASNDPIDTAITEQFIQHVLSRHQKEIAG
jgi:hypothetical protein